MRADVSLEVTRVPQFAQQLTETLHKQKHDVTRWSLLQNCCIVCLWQKIVTQWRHVRERLYNTTINTIVAVIILQLMQFHNVLWNVNYLKNNVAIIVGFNIVQANDARQVGGAVISSRQACSFVKFSDLFCCECWVQKKLQRQGTKELAQNKLMPWFSSHYKPNRLIYTTISSSDWSMIW